MEKILENVLGITTRDDYEKLMSHVEKLIVEATEKGALDAPEADNEYTREIGRLSCLGADYESEYIQFEHIKVKKISPLIRQIENEMHSRNLKEKELAEMIEINEPVLRQIMRGRRSISIRTAKRLHQRLNIDAKLILDYA
jgi:antitoxin component HigA of HigAB toxin-antitoxin module